MSACSGTKKKDLAVVAAAKWNDFFPSQFVQNNSESNTLVRVFLSKITSAEHVRIPLGTFLQPNKSEIAFYEREKIMYQ